LVLPLEGSFSNQRPLVLVGAGKMGGALALGWLQQGLSPDALRVIDPAPPASSLAFLQRYEIGVDAAAPEGVTARGLVIAVKPQAMSAVLPGLRVLLAPDTLVLSIAAGIRLATLGEGLGGGRIVRSMPNTPAEIGRGMTVAIAAPDVDDQSARLAGRLLEAVGKVSWVDDESLIDAATAVSGSGPAYVFLLAEALAAAAVSAGLPADLADILARQTVSGAGELLFRSDLSAETLRKNVTSPNGTTAAALAVLMAANGLPALMEAAVAAAKRRAEELSA